MQSKYYGFLWSFCYCIIFCYDKENFTLRNTTGKIVIRKEHSRNLSYE